MELNGIESKSDIASISILSMAESSSEIMKDL
jgi:hypothetical protein